MGAIAENNKGKDKLGFPDGKIILLDGRILDCYPVAKTKETKEIDDRLRLDTTGEYLSMRKKIMGSAL